MTQTVTEFPSLGDVLAELEAKYPGWQEVKNFVYTPTSKPLTPAEVAAALHKAVVEITEFNNMPEEDKLKFYLKQSLLGIDQILTQTQTVAEDFPNGLTVEGAQNRLLDIFGICETLKAQIPSKYKGG